MPPILRCPVCDSAGAAEVYRSLMPLRTVRRVGAGEGAGHRSEMRLVSCTACGHLFNAAFDPELDEEMYGDGPLTNVPVHPSMIGRLHDLIEWLGVGPAHAPDIVEVGCGSGHLARILAPFARSVTLFEPNRSLVPDMLPEPGIRLVSAPLPPEGLPGGADLVICRQVLEHVADPLALMTAIRTSLRKGGHAYLEVPNGTYVVDHAAFMDVHLQHVQYFSRDGFLHLARRAGLVPVKEQWIKGGHDFGILFAATPFGESVSAPPCTGTGPAGLGRRFTARIAAARRRLNRPGARIGLYGATAQAQAFVNAVAPAGRFPVVFDDTPGLAGFALFDAHHDIPVEAPSAERLATLDTVVVTAYLHDEAITRNLRARGFLGPVLSIRPDPVPGNDLRLDWLFDPGGAQAAGVEGPGPDA